MSNIKERLEKMKREAKERSRLLSNQRDNSSELRHLSHSSGSGSSAMDSKMLITSCSNLNGTATSLAISSSEAAITDENMRPALSLASGFFPSTLNQQMEQNNHTFQKGRNCDRLPFKPLSATRKCSSSCSNLPPLPALIETPLSSHANEKLRAAGASDAENHRSHAFPTPLSRMPKSVSSSNIVYSSKRGCIEEKNPKRIIVAGNSYTLLNQLGKGGSSVVYQAFSNTEKQCVAIKCVDLTNADEIVSDAYENEINLLASLQGSPYVIKMFTFEKRNNRLYVVMERGDIDLATFMRKRSEQIDDKFIKYHWQEMLRCVKVIHDRNIVHSDLKPANFLFVGASLKLIDFGIASNIPSNKTSVVKDIQIGTLNYMSPEAINGFYDEDGVQHYKIPLKSDVWSLGCILYAMVYGATPFHHLPNQIAKIRAISSERVGIKFAPIKNELLIDVMKKCLVRNVKQRASVDELLAHLYLQS